MNVSAVESALKDKAAKAVEMAIKEGAATAVADVYQKKEFDLGVRNGEVEQLSEAESYGILLTVSKDGRRASVSSSDTTRDSLETIASQVVAMCRYTDSDPDYSLPGKQFLATESPELDLLDPNILELGIQDRIDRAMALEKLFLEQDPCIKADGSNLTTIVASSALANSLGFCMADTAGMIMQSVHGFAEDTVTEGDLNKGRKQTGSWSCRSRYIADMQSPQEIASSAARQVLRKLGARKPKTGVYPVYYEPRTAKTVWGHLIKAMAGTAIFRNESFLVDRENTPVCAPQITITDDPLLIRGLRSRTFDNEGVAGKPLDLVRDGVLQTYLKSTYSANKLGGAPTGHAGGSTNVLISAGEYSEDEMLAKMGTGVWVTGLLGSGANISTGDYSRGALGLWVEDGKPVYPIMEFTLNSNLDTMLQNITLLGNNVYPHDAVRTPGFVIGEMTISGA